MSSIDGVRSFNKPGEPIKHMNSVTEKGVGHKIERVFTKNSEIYRSLTLTQREAKITDGAGSVAFSQQVDDVPDFWSDNAVNIVASKYFRGHLGSPERERSVVKLIERVVHTITDWGRAASYFATLTDSATFAAELKHMLAYQMFAFNSPVWFNVGTTGDSPPQCSACFINSVKDDMESIMSLAATEARLFKGGSGSGTNLSPLRSSKETLSGGGWASGPVSFMRGYDAFAGVIKSGGKCLAGTQHIYTAEHGPKQASELAGHDFIAISFDPPSRRYKAKKAHCWASGEKEVLRVTTDKGIFDVSFDHPWRLSSNSIVRTDALREGMSLFACAIDEHEGYSRVHLRDGKKGKMLLHRLVAQDVMGADVSKRVVHHIDGNRVNNTPENLEITSQSEHATGHAAYEVTNGTHLFQTQTFPKSGAANGMHRDSTFWRSDDSVAYRKRQGEILRSSSRASAMQAEAARQKMLNTAFRVLNAGGSLDSFDTYVAGRRLYIGSVPSAANLRNKLEKRFGSFEQFRQEVFANNHRVMSIESLGVQQVFSVEVECSTADDKTPDSGHNYVIWPNGDRYGSGVVVSNTRRAAKIVMLNCDHPDIAEFIDCKMLEEKKAWALIEAGYDGAFTGEAYGSVFFQNANHSVRASDAFMEAVSNDESWDLRAVKNGDVMETVKAKDLLSKIAEATHVCGDPGMQFDTTINLWHTCKNSAPIHASNPCSEFVFLNDTACNLGSLNLLRFYDQDSGRFNVQEFQHACRIAIMAQEIIVDFSSYPTAEIAKNSHDYRPLGLGYANLGALLMTMGLPYDSDAGRNTAAAITALMCGEAYFMSALIAADRGPFAGYEANKEPMRDVISMHRHNALKLSDTVQSDLREASVTAWYKAMTTGSLHGFRNAQVTVLAPTGTIAFMMDCDTTGIEPDIALIKYKRLVGGGMLKIVNRSVVSALQLLGYCKDSREKILEYIDKNETIEGAPGLDEQHLPIFDCAFKAANGKRSILPMGHIKMMAACQPFISGAISKTVNVPEAATVNDIYDMYVQAWQLGLKAIAIYRDGSKRSQPLSTNKKEQSSHSSEKEEALVERRKLPKDRHAMIHKFSIGGHSGYLTSGFYPDGKLGEVFVSMNKQGSTVSGLMDTIAILTSMLLQYGVPLEVLVKRLAHTRFEPSGLTGNPDVPMAKSIVDYMFRYLGSKYIGKPAPAIAAPVLDVQAEPVKEVDNDMAVGAPLCTECGSITQRAGSCYTCPSCGTTSGCG